MACGAHGHDSIPGNVPAAWGRRRGVGHRSSRDAGSDASIGVNFPGNDCEGVFTVSFGDGDAGDGRAAVSLRVAKPSDGGEVVARSNPAHTQGVLGSDKNGRG